MWLFICPAKSAGLIGNLMSVNRLRHDTTHAVPEELINKMCELARALHIKETVSLLQSELVRVPVTIGFFRPLILLPPGLLSCLSPSQVQIILCHELAHIRRNDYLINILQTFIHAFFFFNPFIVWIGSVLTDEGEACCDDVTIEYVGSKKTYIETLISFHEYGVATNRLPMAFIKRKSSLLDRVTRILKSENKKLNTMEKLVLVISITLLMAFHLLPFQNDSLPQFDVKSTLAGIEAKSSVTKQELTMPAETPIVTTNRDINQKASALTPVAHERDTLPTVNKTHGAEKRVFPRINIISSSATRSETIVATDQYGSEYKIDKIDGRIKAITIDGVVLPANEIGNYKVLIDRIDSARQDGQRELNKLINPELRLYSINEHKVTKFNKKLYLMQTGGKMASKWYNGNW